MHSLLTNTTDLLRVITGSAADLDCIVSFIEYTNNASPPVLDPLDTQFTNIVTATTTTILAAPTGSTKRRRIKSVSIVNTHASVSTTCRVIIERTGPVNWDMFNTVTLEPGESLTYTEGLGWFHNKQAIAGLASGKATTAQIASHSADTYYLGMETTYNGVTRLRAGCFFTWAFGVVKGAGTAAPVFSIRHGSAGTVADTSRCAMTLAAQTAVAVSGYIIVDASFRSIGAAAIIVGRVSLVHQLATTGLNVTTTGMQLVQTVGASYDSGIANGILGLSVNPGASAAWVVESCVLDAVNLVF